MPKINLPLNKKPNDKKKGPRRNLFNTISGAALIFVAIIGLYLLATGNNASLSGNTNQTIGLNDLANDISAGKVSEIKVNGDDLTVTYKDKSVKSAKKESESSLTDTLSHYAIAPDKLSAVQIEIVDQSGFSYWFSNLAPIIIPILLLMLFLWVMARQIKGAGMQAFTFGQSRARLTSPEDKIQRVTFKDVAGAKEPK